MVLCPCHSHDHLLPMQDRDLTGLPYADRLAYEYGITISDLGAARWLNREYPPAVIQTREYRSPEVPDTDDPTVFRHSTTLLCFFAEDPQFPPKKQSVFPQSFLRHRIIETG